MVDNKKKLTILGGGVAGVVSAYYLQDYFDITILEANDYLGGHTNTILVDDNGNEIGIDTGFIVLNDQTYPNLHKFFNDLQVAVRYTDMSFSFYSEKSNFEYSGRNLNTLFSKRSNLINPKFYSFLIEVSKFSKNALKDLNYLDTKTSLNDYLKQYKYSNKLIYNYILPIGASIWSTPSELMLDFPAISFLNFFKNHGLLSLKNRPKWQTVIDGSNTYIKKFQKKFQGEIKLKSPIVKIKYENNEYKIFTDKEVYRSEYLISAIPANKVYDITKDIDFEIIKYYKNWEYNKNTVQLHTDKSIMPKNKRTWASWNYLEQRKEDTNLISTYYMNLLQGLKSKNEYFVSLNSIERINKDKIIFQTDYMHPMFTVENLNNIEKIKALNGMNNFWFCGSYFGYGFHEDATKSSIEIIGKIKNDLCLK